MVDLDTYKYKLIVLKFIKRKFKRLAGSHCRSISLLPPLAVIGAIRDGGIVCAFLKYVNMY